jgi:uncharacterized protein (TIGR03067 family)
MFCRISLAVGFLVTGFVLPCVAQAQSLDGNWVVKSGILDGKLVPDIALTSMVLNVTSTKFEARSGSFSSLGTLAANALASPAQLEFTIDSGADAGRKLKAIYALENGQLKVTFSQDDIFPSTFDSTESNRYLSLVYALGQAASTASNTSAGSSETPPVAENSPPPYLQRNMRKQRDKLGASLPGGGG